MGFDVKRATVDQITEEFLRLARNQEEAAFDFCYFLHELELKRQDVWELAGSKTFDGWLNGQRTAINASRYREFVAGLEKVGDYEKARAQGYSAMMGKGIIHDDSDGTKQAQFDDYVTAFKNRNGKAPSVQSAQNQARRIDPPVPNCVLRSNELNQLRAEVVELRAQLRARDRKISDLEKQLQEKKKGGRESPRPTV